MGIFQTPAVPHLDFLDKVRRVQQAAVVFLQSVMGPIKPKPRRKVVLRWHLPPQSPDGFLSWMHFVPLVKQLSLKVLLR